MSQPVALEKPLYTAHATATAGREGTVKTDDGAFEAKLVAPKSLGGPGVGGTNPEQLFAAGYAACFGSAAMHVARAKKLDAGNVTVDANVSLGAVGQAFGLQVELVVTVPKLGREEAQALIEAAHQVCPYSNATRGNIIVDVKLAE